MKETENTRQGVGLARLSIREASSMLRRRALRSVDLVEAYLEQIERNNGGEPSFDGSPSAVNAWVRIYAQQALEMARRADRRLDRERESAPPLCGIPIGLKDMIAVEGEELTASSRVLTGNTANADAAVWSTLAENGAVLLGHTHTHEFAAGGTTDQVGNPWNLKHSAGGSSGGAGAALAAGMVPLAIGTDTAGSVRIPAALCGVAAIKPSFGRISTEGVLPLAWSFDHIGAMARTVEDCVILLSGMTNATPPPSPWFPGVPEPLAYPSQIPTGQSMAGVRIGLTERVLDSSIDPDVQEGLQMAIAECEQQGAEILRLPAPSELSRADYDSIFLSELRTAHAQYSNREGDYRASTRQIVDFSAEELSVGQYIAAQGRRMKVTAEWQTWFVDHGVDALLEPTVASTAPVRGHGYRAGEAIGGTDPLTVFTATWNVTGFPVVSLPTHIGKETQLPVGVSLVGRHGSDQRLVQVALALEGGGSGLRLRDADVIR